MARLLLDATQEELYEKGEQLIELLAKGLFYANPELADVLEKALPARESDLKFQVLRDLKAQTSAEYAATLKRMLKDIGEVLDGSTGLQKGLPGPLGAPPCDFPGQDGQGPHLSKGGPYVGPKGGLWADPQHTQHWVPNHPGALEAFAAQFGGKVVPHFNDATKVVVKLPPQHAKQLLDLKVQQHIADPIITGGKYVMLSVPKVLGAPVSPPPKPAPAPAVVQTPAPAIQKPAPAKPAKTPVPGVPYGDKTWQPHASVEEASAWAKARGVDVAYKDLATANETNRALSEQNSFVQKHVEFLGSQSEARKWAKAHPDINKRAMTEAKHAEDLTQFHLGGGAIAVAHPTTGKPYTKSIVVVRDDYSTADAAAAKQKHTVPGFTRGNRLQDTLRHEFGHVEGFVFRHLYPNGPGQPSAWEIWKSAAIGALKHDLKGVMKQVSQYGATNPHELWSELAVMRRDGSPIPQWAQVAIKKMRIDEVPWESMAAPSLKGGKP